MKGSQTQKFQLQGRDRVFQGEKEAHSGWRVVSREENSGMPWG
jgi:hypothetical protein